MAIILGVTFISGSLVLTDTLHDTFTTLVGNVYQHIDFQVRGKAALNSGGSAVRNPIPESLLAECPPGTRGGLRRRFGHGLRPVRRPTAMPSAAEGRRSASPSTPIERSLAFQLVQGRAPTNPDEVVMDLGTAQKYHFTVGERVRILLPSSPQTFTITGLLKFGTADNLAGATIAAFDLPTAQKLFGLVGQLNTINVLTTPGADKDAVQRDIARSLPSGVEVVTGQTVVNEQTTVIDQALSVFSTALVVFALIALFVGGFTIFNTFSIIVGQRTRELALLADRGRQPSPGLLAPCCSRRASSACWPR